MQASRVEFVTQIDRALLAELHALAQEEDCEARSLVEEALKNLLKGQSSSAVRPRVMRAYRESQVRFDSLYKKLAS